MLQYNFLVQKDTLNTLISLAFKDLWLLQLPLKVLENVKPTKGFKEKIAKFITFKISCVLFLLVRVQKQKNNSVNVVFSFLFGGRTNTFFFFQKPLILPMTHSDSKIYILWVWYW